MILLIIKWSKLSFILRVQAVRFIHIVNIGHKSSKGQWQCLLLIAYFSADKIRILNFSLYMKNHFSHKGLFGSQTKCFIAISILSDYKSIDYRSSGSPDFLGVLILMLVKDNILFSLSLCLAFA